MNKSSIKGNLDPALAQAGREAMRERCLQIAAEETPESVSIFNWRKSLSGCAYAGDLPGTFLIEVPRPYTRKSLYIYLHEIGHVILGHCDPKVDRKLKAWQRERQAEDFAHEKMREHGLAVPRSMTQRAHRYVARKKEFGRRSSHRHQWEEFPEGYEQRGEWLRCGDKNCNAMKHI